MKATLYSGKLCSNTAKSTHSTAYRQVVRINHKQFVQHERLMQIMSGFSAVQCATSVGSHPGCDKCKCSVTGQCLCSQSVLSEDTQSIQLNSCKSKRAGILSWCNLQFAHAAALHSWSNMCTNIYAWHQSPQQGMSPCH